MNRLADPGALDRRRALALAALALSPALLAAAPAAAEGGWSLSLVGTSTEQGPPLAFVIAAEAGSDAPTANVSLVLRVDHTGPDGNATSWDEPARTVAVSPGARVEARLAASRGAGTYVVAVLADGAAPLEGVTLVAPDDAGAEATLVVEVPEAPTRLAYTGDAVNGAGKTKTPGDALIARIRVGDDNGLDDVAAVEFAHARITADGARVNVSVTIFENLTENATSPPERDLEHRFAASPIPAGDYVEVVTAIGRSGERLTVERTFRISDPRPQLLGSAPLDPASVRPDAAHVLEGAVRVGDRNFGTGPTDAASVPGLGVLTARLYRASTRIDDPAWNVTLSGDAWRLDLTGVGHREAPSYRVADGFGAVDVPVRVAVPAGAPSGDYRVSVYHALNATSAASLIGTLPFAVSDLPRVSGLAVAPAAAAPGDEVAVEFTLAGGAAERVEVRLLRARGDAWEPVGEPVVAAPDADVVALAVPADLPPGAYLVEAAPAAAADAPVLDVASGSARRVELRLEAGPPALALHSAGGGARISAGPRGGAAPFRLDARNFTLADATLAWSLENATGAATPADERVTRAGAGFRVDASGLAPGRYVLRVRADAPTGAAEAALHLDVGAWVAVRLPRAEAAVEAAPGGGLAASLPLAADGNAPVRGLVVAVGTFRGGERAEGEAILEGPDGTVRARGTLARGVARLSGDLLAAGEAGVLRVALATPPGLDAGRHELALRVHVAPGEGGR